MKKVKQTFANTLLLVSGIFMLGCAGKMDMQAESQVYTLQGRYYTDGTIITNDGNIWDYQADKVNYDAFECRDGSILFDKKERETFDNMPIYVKLSDNATENITDDIIIEVGFDFMQDMRDFNAKIDRIIEENNKFIQKTDNFIKDYIK